MGTVRQPTIRNDPRRNPAFSASTRVKHVPTNNDDDDEDTRDMTGRIRTEAGYEVCGAKYGIYINIFYNNRFSLPRLIAHRRATAS